MESSIDQSLKKAFEKEKWLGMTTTGQTSGAGTASTSLAAGSTSKTQIVTSETDKTSLQAVCTCASTDELYWKLNALQTFFKQLNWPDKIFSSHLTTRLSRQASDKIIDAVKRTMAAFLSFKKKTLTAGVAARFQTPTDYVVPVSLYLLFFCYCRCLKV